MIFEIPYGRWCILAKCNYRRYAFRVFANSIIDTYNVRYIEYKNRKKLTKHLLIDEDLFKGIHKYFTTLRFKEESQDQETVLDRLIKELEKRGFTILCKICISENEIIP